ncbi:MAG: hypothetical protein WDW38_008920 [Sanguina aurantia]
MGLQSLAPTARAAKASSESTSQPEPAAGSVQQAYDGYAGSYDTLDGGAAAEVLGFPELRKQLIAQASGSVLEVGIGTGLNLPFYTTSGPTAVSQLTGVDLSSQMLGQAQQRAQTLPGFSLTAGGSSPSLRLRQADVTSLPFPDASFDTVLDTFSLCVFTQPAAALKEMARVLRPSGRLLLLEHARSENALLAAYQDVTADTVAALGKGCVWNQDVARLCAEAGLRVTQQQRHTAGTIIMIEAVRA